VPFDSADPGAQAACWAEAVHYTQPPPPPGFDSWDAALDAWASRPTTATTARRSSTRGCSGRGCSSVVLAKAARIVRAALARRRLALADLEGDVVKPAELVADLS
jgi:hypothetical protein